MRSWDALNSSPSSGDARQATRHRNASPSRTSISQTSFGTGAKVRLAGTAPVPNEVWLIEVREGLAFRCRVAWRASPELGLEFSASHDLKDPTSPELRMLKRIWVENAAR